MGYPIEQNNTARPLLFLMVDSTDHLTGKVGLSPTVTLSKNGGAFAACTGAVTELGSGWYQVAANATDAATLGVLLLHATATGADPTDESFEVVGVSSPSITGGALSGYYNRGQVRGMAFDLYGEDAGGYQFPTATMNTFVRQATERFAIETGVVLGSARRARPSSTTTEAVLTIPTGMFVVNRVQHQHHRLGIGYSDDVRRGTKRYLNLRYGSDWATTDNSIARAGLYAQNEVWYWNGNTQIGIFPPTYAVGTVGTVVLHGRSVPSTMQSDTAGCAIPPQYVPGVVNYVAMLMAKRDADADPDGRRAKDFEEAAQLYVKAAGGPRTWTVED